MYLKSTISRIIPCKVLMLPIIALFSFVARHTIRRATLRHGVAIGRGTPSSLEIPWISEYSLVVVYLVLLFFVSWGTCRVPIEAFQQ